MFKFTVMAAAMIFATQLTGCGRIESGNVGVRTTFNKTIETAEIAPGWYGAILTTVDEFVAKETEVQMNDMRPKAKDNLTLEDMDVSVFYKVASDQVAEVVIKYSGMSPKGDNDGLFYPGFNLVERNVRGAIYDVIGTKYESLSVHAKRNELEEDIRSRVQSDLDKSDKGVFTITKVVVRNVVTDRALEESIQASVKVQKEIERKKGQIDLARAEAERIRVESEGQAAANRIISDSIDNRLIELRRIEAMQKFAGEGTHTVIMPTGQNALVNVGK